MKEIQDEIDVPAGLSIGAHGKGAWMRSAISRAYYSAYLVLREAILKSRYSYIISNVSDDHEAIKTLLENLPSSLIKHYNDFKYLRKYRNHSDYDLPPIFRVNYTDVQKSYVKAEAIITNITTIMNNL